MSTITVESFILKNDAGITMNSYLGAMCIGGLTENDAHRIKNGVIEAKNGIHKLLDPLSSSDLERLHTLVSPLFSSTPFAESRILNASRHEILEVLVPLEPSHQEKVVRLARTILKKPYLEEDGVTYVVHLCSMLHPKRLDTIIQVAGSILGSRPDSKNEDVIGLLYNLRDKTIKDLKEVRIQLIDDQTIADRLLAFDKTTLIIVPEGRTRSLWQKLFQVPEIKLEDEKRRIAAQPA
jgi:hypothetical protein